MIELGFKNLYRDQWKKAAENCKQVIGDLTAGFAQAGLKLRSGHGALSCDEESSDHNHGEPDIFLLFNDNIIGGIEVTGSDRVNWPCEVWIGAHKMKYARKVYFPIAFVLFYPNERRFVTAKMVTSYAPEPEERTVYGGIEHYHVLNPHHTQGYSQLRFFVEGLVEFAKREDFQREIYLDEPRGCPW